MSTIVIVGGGLVGSVLAVTLQLEGYSVIVYERWADPRLNKVGGAKSINLSLTSRGLRAVPKALKADVESLGTKVTGRILHQRDGSVNFQRYGVDDSEFNLSVSRGALNKLLLERAEAAGVELHFEHELVDIDIDTERWCNLKFKSPAGDVNVACEGPLVGADGGGSAVRNAMEKKGLIQYTADKLGHGYKEVLFPLGPDSQPTIETHGLHIWPRGQHFLMALANLDGSFTGTIYMAYDGCDSFKQLTDEDSVKAFFEEHYRDAIPLLGGIDRIKEQILGNPIGTLGTIRTNKWHEGGSVGLVGDSAHAVVPFFGQGMNCGFEDVSVLRELLLTHAPPGQVSLATVAVVFQQFEEARKANANSIADMALENCVEMMAKTADPNFLVRKKAENVLENKFGDKFRSRYAMVCYGGAGNITYRNAQILGEKQAEILTELCSNISDADELDLERAATLIDDRLVPLQQQLGVDLTTVRVV